MNTKLHAVSDANGRPLSFFMTAGQVSGYTGAAALLDDLPKAQWLPGDRGYDADWFRDALHAKGIQPCIPGRKSRLSPSGMTSVGTGAAAASRSCSAAPMTGAASLPATTDAQRPSSPPSPSQPPSSSGYDQSVLTLGWRPTSRDRRSACSRSQACVTRCPAASRPSDRRPLELGRQMAGLYFERFVVGAKLVHEIRARSPT